MLLEAGPVPQLSGKLSADFAPEPPGFGEMTRAALADLPALEGAIDDHASVIVQIVGSDPTGSILDILAPADAEYPTQVMATYVSDPTDIPGGTAYTGELLSNAWALTPGEAFLPVPDPQIYPNEPPPTPQPGNAQHTLVNLSRPGATDWRVGDSFLLQIHVLPGVGGFTLYQNLPLQMLVYDEYTSQLSQTIDLGNTDDAGFLSFQGTFYDFWLGRWGINIESPGRAVEAALDQFHLVINAAVGPVIETPRQISAQLYNVANPGSTVFHIGDQFSVTVGGPPNSAVEIDAVFNGQQFPRVAFGQTNSVGVLVISGTMSAAELGDWIEHYWVGGVPWAGQIAFSVQA